VTLAILSVAGIVGSCSRATSPESGGALQRTAAGRTEAGSTEDRLFITWEYAGAIREREIAKLVLTRSTDPEIRALAEMVRDGHRAGMDAMKPIAADLGIVLQGDPTPSELEALALASEMSSDELEHFFLRRQRAMHAWDLTVFKDYAAAATHPRLRQYVEATIRPLAEHAQQIEAAAGRRGINGRLTLFGE
jgi:predicted outer membrane protein